MWTLGRSPYRLMVVERPHFLHAVITAEKDSFEVSLDAVTELAAICRAKKSTRLLAEHDIPSRLSALDIYKIATQIPDLYQGIVVAFVIHQPGSPGNPLFLEHVARNRGAKGRLFGTAGEAEAWLLSL